MRRIVTGIGTMVLVAAMLLAGAVVFRVRLTAALLGYGLAR